LKENIPRDNRPRFDRIHKDINAAFFDGMASAEAVARVSLENVHRWYEDFDGEPGPSQSPASAMFADSYPQRNGDPNKILRAAAFAGWVITPTSTLSLDEIGDLIERYTGPK
jgi:selenocysteine lyase/cysteine desulfurase